MPTMRGLGFEESCMLALNVGSQTSGKQDLSRFGTLVEVIPVRLACLISYYSMVDSITMGLPMSSVDGISPKARLLGFGVCVGVEREFEVPLPTFI